MSTLELDYLDPKFEAIDHYFACINMCNFNDNDCPSHCLSNQLGFDENHILL